MKINPLQVIFHCLAFTPRVIRTNFVKTTYEMYVMNLKMEFAVKATKQLFQSVGLVSGSTISWVNLNESLTGRTSDAGPQTLVSAGLGDPCKIATSVTKICNKNSTTFESEVTKDWKMPVSGIHWNGLRISCRC